MESRADIGEVEGRWGVQAETGNIAAQHSSALTAGHLGLADRASEGERCDEVKWRAAFGAYTSELRP